MTITSTQAALRGLGKPLHDLTLPQAPQRWQTQTQRQSFARDDDYYLDQLIDAVWKSPLVCDAFRLLKDQGTGIAFSTLHEGQWFFDADTNMLLLQRPSRLLRQTQITVFDDLALALIEGLSFILVNDTPDLSKLALRQRLLAERARAAHSDILQVRMCWELKAAGVCGVWRQLRTSLNSDLADVFSDVLDRSPIVATACRSAFLQWFKNPARIARVDMQTLTELDQIGEAYGQDALTALDLLAITRDPDGPSLYRSIFATILQHKTFSMMTDPLTQAYLKQLERDQVATKSGGISMRDAALAKRLFPDGPLS